MNASNYLKKSLNQPMIMRTLECPFVDIPLKEKIPGPGNYFKDDSKEKVAKMLKQVLMKEEPSQPKPPFNS